MKCKTIQCGLRSAALSWGDWRGLASWKTKVSFLQNQCKSYAELSFLWSALWPYEYLPTEWLIKQVWSWSSFCFWPVKYLDLGLRRPQLFCCRKEFSGSRYQEKHHVCYVWPLTFILSTHPCLHTLHFWDC